VPVEIVWKIARWEPPWGKTASKGVIGRLRGDGVGFSLYGVLLSPTGFNCGFRFTDLCPIDLCGFCAFGGHLNLARDCWIYSQYWDGGGCNILIFERTREELQAGKSLYRSVESGFYRAFSSILDGNVTTLIACAALFWLGTGLVKGFALTLGLGVLVSMFTALTCSRTLLLFVLTIPSLRRVEFYAPKSALVKS
jgi:hypothetical protein